MHSHLTRDVRNDLYSILKFYSEHRIRQRFNDGSVLLYSGLFCHIININVLLLVLLPRKKTGSQPCLA